ncbi:bifunctional arginine demethylase and lysyl-hydroxylase JMJD6-like [Ciona intestinalis]
MATAREFEGILKQADSLGVSDEQLNRLKSIRKIRNEGKKWRQQNADFIIAGSVLFIAFALPVMSYYLIQFKTRLGSILLQRFFATNDQYYKTENVTKHNCIVQSRELIDSIRHPVDCSRCAGVTDVKYATNLSHEEFLEKYAFTMQPLVVKDGQINWTARETINFGYLKTIYTPGSKALDMVNSRCQFFPYNTDIDNMEEFFNMSKSRLEGKEDHWYVGWSNCGGPSANVLKSHYKLPYFLPMELDHSRTDWIFMGLPGYGAPMHVDYVTSSSWQAQLTGYKKWTLETPPECYGTCQSQIVFTVGPGDIMVFDGTSWFHKTDVVGDDMSVVIGSEYY